MIISIHDNFSVICQVSFGRECMMDVLGCLLWRYKLRDGDLGPDSNPFLLLHMVLNDGKY